MGIGLALNRTSLAAEIEVVEGTYVPEAAGTSFIEVLEDGVEGQIAISREILDQNNLTDSVEQLKSRQGAKDVTGAINTPFKSSGVEGAAPETRPLWLGLLGAERTIAATVTTGTGHTASVLNIADPDIANFAINQVILIKEAGAFHVAPIIAVDPTIAAANITIGVPAAAPFTDNVEIAPMTQYFHQSPAPTLSLTRYIGGEIRQYSAGNRVASGSIDNWSTGQVLSNAFTTQALSEVREVGTELFPPEFEDSTAPVALDACIWMDIDDGNGLIQIPANDFQLSMENEIGAINSFCSSNGKIGTRNTRFKVSGSFNPYMEDDDVDRWNNFETCSRIALFGYAYSKPDCITTDPEDIVAFYIPNATITALPVGNQEGIATDALEFQAYREDGNDSVFISFI